MVLGALGAAARTAGAPRAAAGDGSGPPIAAFVASRPSDTADTRGPYRVEFRQISGPAPAGGRVEYEVTEKDGARLAGGRSALASGGDGLTWVGEIPGQSPESTITYHAVFASGSGADVRHPLRVPAAYRFRVVPLRAVVVRHPSSSDLDHGRAPIRVVVEALAAPSAEAVVRMPGVDGEPGEEIRVPLSIARRRRSGSSSSYQMAGELPVPEPGGIVDFYIATRGPGGGEIRIPADAPARVHSIKRSFVPVRRVPGGRCFVLDLAAVGGRRWIGLKGGRGDGDRTGRAHASARTARRRHLECRPVPPS